MIRIVLLAVLLSACGPKSNDGAKSSTATGKPLPVTQTCSCDTYPFPNNCATECEKVELVVTSLSPDKQTAFVTVEKNGAAQKISVPASRLPGAVPGKSFTTLVKKNPAAPENPNIVRFLTPEKLHPAAHQ
jgi:hypothetical protein